MQYLKTAKFWTVFLIAMIASYLLTCFAVTGELLLASLFMQYALGRLSGLFGNFLMLYLTICAFRLACASGLKVLRQRPPSPR